MGDADATEAAAILDLIRRLADAAAAETLSRFRTNAYADNKASSGFDPVTEADRAAERAIRELLARERPDDGVDGEEYGREDGASGWLWRLDPVDGTRAFIAGLPLWTTLIALESPDGTPLYGAISQPFIGELYLGWPGGAALEKGGERRALKTRACRSLTEAIVSTTDPFIFTPPERGAFEHVRATARLTRYGCDAYAYARLAAGDIDLVIESGLQPHDVAALAPVVTGAGGRMTDWSGVDFADRPGPAEGQVVASGSDGPLADALISLRRSAGARAGIFQT